MIRQLTARLGHASRRMGSAHHPHSAPLASTFLLNRRHLSDRSFRLASVDDLAVAQDHLSKVDYQHFVLKRSAEVKPREMAKQIVIDLSHSQGYRRGHIKGAVNLSVEKFDFCRPVDIYGGIFQDDIYAVMKDLGVGNDTSEIILYDNSGMLACRLWFVLRYFGFSNIRILNGGWRNWLRAGLPVDESDVTPKAAASLDLKPKRMSLLIRPTGMVFDVEHKTSKYIDARLPSAYSNYHIEGAVNIPATEFVEDAHFKTVAEIRERAKKAGLSLEEDKLIAYSGKSLSAAVDLFCLSMAGAERVSVFDAGVNTWRANFDQKLSLEAETFLKR